MPKKPFVEPSIGDQDEPPPAAPEGGGLVEEYERVWQEALDGRVGRGRKRYCPRCRERIRHTAWRCHVCGTLTPRPRDYFALALLILVAAALLLRFYL